MYKARLETFKCLLASRVAIYDPKSHNCSLNGVCCFAGRSTKGFTYMAIMKLVRGPKRTADMQLLNRFHSRLCVYLDSAHLILKDR